MYDIKSKVGDSIEVTLVQGLRGLQMEGFINGLPAYASRRSPPANATDRWLVRIAGCNHSRTAYFFTGVAPIEAGNGFQTTLQLVTSIVDEKEDTEWALKIAAGKFGHDRLGLCVFMARLLDYYAFVEKKTAAQSSFDWAVATAYARQLLDEQSQFSPIKFLLLGPEPAALLKELTGKSVRLLDLALDCRGFETRAA